MNIKINVNINMNINISKNINIIKQWLKVIASVGVSSRGRTVGRVLYFRQNQLNRKGLRTKSLRYAPGKNVHKHAWCACV